MDTVLHQAERWILRTDQEGNVTALNDQAERTLGRGAVGQPCHRVVRGLTDGGVPYCREGCAADLACGRLELRGTAKVKVGQESRPGRLYCTRIGGEAFVVADIQGEVAHSERLTKREREVLALVARGLSSSQVAVKLGIQVSTVRTHVEHALGRLGANTRAEAVRRAIRTGQIDQ